MHKTTNTKFFYSAMKAKSICKAVMGESHFYWGTHRSGSLEAEREIGAGRGILGQDIH